VGATKTTPPWTPSSPLFLPSFFSLMDQRARRLSCNEGGKEEEKERDTKKAQQSEKVNCK